MSHVEVYNRSSTSPFFNIYACKDGSKDTKDCREYSGSYHVVNDDSAKPKGFAYMQTADKAKFFVPKTDTLSQMKTNIPSRSCWKIDPCTPQTAEKCCDTNFRDDSSDYQVPFAKSVVATVATNAQKSQPSASKMPASKPSQEEQAKDENESRIVFWVLFFIGAALFLVAIVWLITMAAQEGSSASPFR